uniref:Mucin-7-like n=1 Tax=Nicotiana tabacum TaxID=4097 RepID=A0A1S3Z7W1_TOBAC|nr:PREDICTED: mucin-7-like [Nicotiana tabacum]
MAKMEMGDEVCPWLAQYLEIPGTIPDWLIVGVKILRRTLNFEAMGWETFVCSRLGPTTHDQTLPLHRAVLVASIMAGLKGNDNPKDKNYKAPASTPTGQSEKPVVVEVPAEPTSISADMPPGPSTSSSIPPTPSTSAGPEIPSTRTASSKLSTLTTTVEAQPVPQPSQVTLTKAIDSHSKALKELAREHKMLRKTRASKESVKELRADRPPKRRKIPRADDAIIQLADPPEASSSQPQDVSVPHPVEVQAQVPVEAEQTTGNQSKVPEHIVDPGTTNDPTQTDTA